MPPRRRCRRIYDIQCRMATQLPHITMTYFIHTASQIFRRLASGAGFQEVMPRGRYAIETLIYYALLIIYAQR